MNRSLFLQFGLALLVCAVAVGTVVGASLAAIQTRERASQLELEVAEKQSEVLRIASAKTALPVLAHSEETLRTYRTKSSDIVPFLERLEKQGKTEGATVEVLSVSPEQVGTQSRISISLIARGTFGSVMSTIGSIEYGPYDVSIKSATLDTSVGTQDKTAEWVATVVLSLGTDQAAKK